MLPVRTDTDVADVEVAPEPQTSAVWPSRSSGMKASFPMVNESGKTLPPIRSTAHSGRGSRTWDSSSRSERERKLPTGCWPRHAE